MSGKPIYLGVDIAGKDNTWAAALSTGDSGLEIVYGPSKATLRELVDYCEQKNVVAVAIDAQLTAALCEENGFRTSDIELREMLYQRQGSRSWAASASGLLAVPVRGRLLAEYLSPTVGTVVETHPRASLLFALGQEALSAIQERTTDYIEELWEHWSRQFRIAPYTPAGYHDGALDSLVCATVAYLYHHDPDQLCRLRHTATDKRGRGPFYVIDPG